MSEHARANQVTVLCPMRIERVHVRRALDAAGLERVPVVQTGIGREAVVRAAGRVAPGGLVILAGACGGLVHGEDVPRIGRVVDGRGGVWTPFMAEAGGATLTGVDEIVSTPDDKAALAARTGASIVDMEAHALAPYCEGRGVAWAVVRGVSDTPEETLPREVLGWITPGGDERRLRAAWDMVRRPSLVPQVRGAMVRAGRVLPEVGRRVVEIVRVWEARGGSAVEGTGVARGNVGARVAEVAR